MFDTAILLTESRMMMIIIWTVVLFRFWLHQTPLGNRSDKINVRVNRLWRVQNTIMGLSIVLIYGPVAIFRLNNYLTACEADILNAIGIGGTCICGLILLHMKNILEHKNEWGTMVFAISLPVAFLIWNGAASVAGVF